MVQTSIGQTLKAIILLSFIIYCLISRNQFDNNRSFDNLIAGLLSKSAYCAMCMVIRCAQFGLGHSPHLILQRRGSDTAVVITFNIFSYDAGWADNRTNYPQNAERIYNMFTLKILEYNKEKINLTVKFGTPLIGARLGGGQFVSSSFIDSA